MTTPQEPAQAPDAFAEPVIAAPLDDETATFFQEINERRAHVENAELLAHLRSL